MARQQQPSGPPLSGQGPKHIHEPPRAADDASSAKGMGVASAGVAMGERRRLKPWPAPGRPRAPGPEPPLAGGFCHQRDTHLPRKRSQNQGLFRPDLGTDLGTEPSYTHPKPVASMG
jgi:hypothetical protein